MDKTKKLLNKGTSVVKSHKIIVGIILLIVFSMIIYYTLFKKEKTSDKYIQKNSVSKYLFFPKDHPSNEPYKIEQAYIRNPTNGEMSMSVFVKVNNWYENFDSWKHILHKGTEISTETNKTFKSLRYQSPGLWFHPKINNLRFVLSVYNDFKFKHKYCDISNIPIGKYFHIVFTIEGNTLSIFINKKLVKTCVFEGIPILTEGDIYVNYGVTYNGYIKNLQFFDRVLPVKDIENLYSKYY